MTAAVLLVAVTLAGMIVSTRNDGYARRSVRVFAGTRWLVDRELGRVVLADASSGRATARIDARRSDRQLDTVQGSGGTYLFDRSSGEVLTIDQPAVKLADARAAPALTDARSWTLGVGADGALAVAADGIALIVPDQGAISQLRIAPTSAPRVIGVDGSIWTLRQDELIERALGGVTTTTRVERSPTDAMLSALGQHGVLLDRANRTFAGLTDSTVVDLPMALDLTDAIVQQPGVDAHCAWVGAADQLACVSPNGVESTVRVDGFSFQRQDRLLSAKGVLAVVRADGTVLRIDPTNGDTTSVTAIDWAAPTDLALSSDEVAIWVDDPSGRTALALTAEATRVIDKRDETAPLFNAEGEPAIGPGGTEPSEPGGPAQASSATGSVDDVPEPDNNGVDDPPVATDDFVSSVQDVVVTVHAAANDYDPDGGPVAISSVGRAAHGQVRVLDTATIVYQPDVRFTGTDQFEYTIVDTGGAHDTGVVHLQLLSDEATNQPPRTLADVAQTSAGRAVTIDVLSNDVDPEQGALRIASVSQPPPSRGTATIVEVPGGRPALRFSPAGGFVGGDVTMTYQAQDDEGATSADTTVTVHVNDPRDGNHPPVAVADSAKVAAGASVTIPVLTNDKDPDNDLLAIDSVSVDKRTGSASIEGSSIRFSAAPSTSGTLTFEYTISDPDGERSSATVLVAIVPPDQVNGAPVAGPDVATIAEGSIDLFPLTNDIDPDGDPLAIVDARTVGSGGLVQLVDASRVRFTAIATQGTARIAYTVSDGRGGSASSTITVTITGIRSASGPVASPDLAIAVAGTPTPLAVLANDNDPNNEPLTVVSTRNCPPARCELEHDGEIMFTAPASAANSSIEFTYTIQNNSGQTASATVRVKVLAADAPNSAPWAVVDTPLVPLGESVQLAVLDNDYDPDGPRSELMIVDVAPSTGAAPTINPDATTIQLIVPSDYSGETYAFAYTISDRRGATSSARVIARVVRPTGRSPIADDDRFSIIAGAPPSTLNLVANDHDPDGDDESLHLADLPTITGGGELVDALSRTGTRSVRLSAKGGAAGVITLHYRVLNAGGHQGEADVTVVVDLPRNGPPVALDDTAATSAGTPVDIAVLTNDDDPDSDALTVAVRRPPPASEGTAELLAGNQTFRFTPAAGFSGTSTFTYVATDPSNAISAPATVTVTVRPCTDAPPSTPDRLQEFTPYDTTLTLRLLDGPSASSVLGFDQVTGGSVAPTSTPGTVVFTPTAGNSGAGGFTYRAVNACGAASSGIVAIDVNRAPILQSPPITVLVGTVAEIAVASFAADDESLVLSAASSAGGEASVGVDGRVLRFVAPGTRGEVQVGVTVTDPGGLTASGTFSIRVIDPTNAAPIAQHDGYVIAPGATSALDVLANDSDPDGSADGLSIQLLDDQVTIEGSPVALTVSPDGRQVVADVPVGTHGTASFSYRALDEFGAASAPAMVAVTVNRAPTSVSFEVTVAAGTTVSTAMYAPGASGDVDGDEIVADVTATEDERIRVLFIPGLHAQITVPTDVAAGDVRIVYAIYDSFGGQGVGTIVVHVTDAGGPTSTS